MCLMRKSNKGSIDPKTAGTLAIIGLIFSAIVGLWLVTFAGTPLGATGYVGSLLLVVHANMGFWIMFIVAVTFGFYRKISNPKEFVWCEMPIQLASSTLSLILLFSLFFSTSTNLTDTEVWNGYVTGAEFYEGWTEKTTHEVDEYDSKGNRTGSHTETTYTYHPPEWKECTTAGDTSIDHGLYNKLAGYFGNEKKKLLYHIDQSSIGDGNMYYVTYAPGQHEIIPASRPHWFVNYLKASDSVEKMRGGISLYKDLLRPYPQVYYGSFGEIELDRVIDAGVQLPEKWKVNVDKTLDRTLTQLGSTKQVNVLVYAVKTADIGFAQALEEFWVKGKKNDVIVLVGVTEFPKIAFAHVIAWTKIEEFRINLRNKILETGDLSDGIAFANAITEEISKPPSQGGFERRPMADLEYLIADIRLPWWCQLLIVLIGGAASWGTSLILINNNNRKH